MQDDFHYYATYCAAIISGYSHEESLEICYSAELVDHCSRTLLSKIRAPLAAATTQLQSELMDARTDILEIQNITRIWASFHFLPFDLRAKLKHRSALYMNKYRLICNTNSDLLVDTVHLAGGGSLQAAGIAMHILADTWAHRYFAGTPSLVINNVNSYCYELISDEEKHRERAVTFHHNPVLSDDVYKGYYSNSVYQVRENSIMNLGHGRAGHLPDYSFIRYKYLPAWGEYAEIIKDNPSDYYHAFCQMIYAMKVLRGTYPIFEKEKYDTKAVTPWEDEIHEILTRRRLNASKDWKEFGERLSGHTIEDFDLGKFQEEYGNADKKLRDNTFLGKFCLAAMAQKSMVTNQIYKSGNMLAGFSVDYDKFGFKGIKDFMKLVENEKRGS